MKLITLLRNRIASQKAKNLVKEFKKLKLSEYPVDKIAKLNSKIGKLGLIVITIHEGETIIRARPNNGDQSFDTIDQLSFKPKECNKTFQRASTPNTTMFYGCIVPQNLNEGELDNARVTASFETSYLLRNKIEKGEEKITFSRWTVTEDITFVAIVYHQEFEGACSYTKELSDAYKSRIAKDPDYGHYSRFIVEFLAQEFAKNTKEDYDYLISAMFTESVIQKNVAGVYYPSMQTEGKGFNVAIHPHYVKKSMKPVAVSECTIYKNGDKVMLDNEASSSLKDNQTKFKLEPVIDPNEHAGASECRRQVGLDGVL